jgi:uncharacterized protein (DUF2147 family)
MKMSIPMLAAALLAASLPALAQTGATPAVQPRPPVETGINGLWLNPHATVAVRTGECGARLCGWVAWASPQAIQDAHDSGVDHLIGTELLEDYETDGAGRWSGSVYVPDMGHHFSSTISRTSADTLKIQGCLIGGFFCKSQVWQRIEKVPNA